MRITDSTVASQAQHRASTQQQTRLAMRYQAPQQQHSAAQQQTKQKPDVQLSQAGQKQAASQVQSGSDSTRLSPYLSLVKRLVEAILGHEINISDFIAGAAGTSNNTSATPTTTTPTPATTAQAGASIEYSQSYQETESAQYTTTGTVKTADGREIDFTAQLSLARSYSETTTLGVYAGSAARPQKDPLILNFGGTAGQLSSKTFSFDLDNDGQQDQISQLKQGAAFLALDKDSNGKIDNGSELFGTQTGNGFAELAAYDDDGNGWIDEGDAVFGKLQLWLKDESGQDKLVSLKDMGVGAIYLGAAKADFNINDENNNTLGKVRSSGVYLTEAGAAGSLQQVDLSV